MSLTGKGKRNATNYRAGGTRGGRSEFQWESVKNEKYRENYLGHSVMAPVGRWQRGKDLTWFAKDKKEQARVAADERARIIEMEKQMRAERLGLAPKTHRDPGNQLVDHELDVLRRGNIERDEKEMSGSRVDGLGAADAPTHAVQATSRFSGEAADRLPGSIAAYAASQAAAGAGAPSLAAAVAESSRDKRARPDWDNGSGGGGGGGAEAAWAGDKKRHKKHRKKKKKSSKKHSSKDSKKKKKKKKSQKQKKKHSRRKRHDSSASGSGHDSGSGSDSGSSSGSGSGSEGSGSDADLAAIQAQIRAQEEKLRALAGDQ